MRDFRLFRLRPVEGRLVLGFGAAFHVKGTRVEQQIGGRHLGEK
jgi:putative heme iron utilization protein